MKKSVLSFLLVLILIFSTFSAALPASAAQPVTEAQVIARLAEAEAIWPDTEAYEDGLDDGVTLCFGFIRELFLYLFDAQLPRMWTVGTARFVENSFYIENVTEIGHLDSGYSLDELKALLSRTLPGDVLIASGGSSNHGVIVRSADGSGAGVYVYDANWGKTSEGKPILYTNRYWSADSLHSQWSSAVTVYRYGSYLEPDRGSEDTHSPEEPRIPDSVQVHLKKVNHYTSGQFADVSDADDWYAGSVGEAYELGLMTGNGLNDSGENIFNPVGQVTVAQAVTIASRIHSLYTTGENVPSASAGGEWYQMYLDYAFENGIIGEDVYHSDVTGPVTRARFAEILALALPGEALYEINHVADDAIPDVKMDSDCAESIYMLYRAGIFGGSDGNGTFYPQNSIRRAEAACVIARMANSDNRIQVNL